MSSDEHGTLLSWYRLPPPLGNYPYDLTWPPRMDMHPRIGHRPNDPDLNGPVDWLAPTITYFNIFLFFSSKNYFLISTNQICFLFQKYKNFFFFLISILKSKFLKIENKNYYQTSPHHLVLTWVICLVGPNNFWPWPFFTLEPKARAEEEYSRGCVIKVQIVLRHSRG